MKTIPLITLGHKTGDPLLRETGKRLTACMRDCDTAARLGGDEFVVIIEGLGESDDDAAASAKLVAEKISRAVAQPYLLAGHQCFSTASIGIRVFTGKQDDIDEVMQQADIAMYKSKAAGRKAIHFFAPALQTAVNQRVYWKKTFDARSEQTNFNFTISLRWIAAG